MQRIHFPSRIVEFIKTESSAGVFLCLMAILAIIVANTSLYSTYDYVLHEVHFGFGPIDKSVLHWINDGLMAIFFFLVGLEIKREFVEGELSSKAQAILPALAAVGGMAVPALIYLFINRGVPLNHGGWAIPAATDIAFALGVLSVLGTRAPIQLKIILTAIAVLDDLGAIVIIAIFYSGDILMTQLYIAAAILVLLSWLAWRKIPATWPYIVLGILLWAVVLQSGVHATLAGVATAMFVPVRNGERLMNKLHHWVAFGILPLFAFANAGVPFTGMGFHSLFEPLTLGIILGLFIGKQLGIFGTLYLCIKSRLCPMPAGVTWTQLYGLSILCGIGFTMSLFIGGLAFTGLEQQAEIRLGVLAGSILSAVVGYGIIRFSSRANDTP